MEGIWEGEEGAVPTPLQPYAEGERVAARWLCPAQGRGPQTQRDRTLIFDHARSKAASVWTPHGGGGLCPVPVCGDNGTP